eukprot:15456901-Alexandrium_andersonii.AAC.1
MSVHDFAGQGQVALRIIPRDEVGGKSKKCKDEEQPELSPSPDAREEVVDRPYTYKEVVWFQLPGTSGKHVVDYSLVRPTIAKRLPAQGLVPGFYPEAKGTPKDWNDPQ